MQKIDPNEKMKMKWITLTPCQCCWTIMKELYLVYHPSICEQNWLIGCHFFNKFEKYKSNYVRCAKLMIEDIVLNWFSPRQITDWKPFDKNWGHSAIKTSLFGCPTDLANFYLKGNNKFQRKREFCFWKDETIDRVRDELLKTREWRSKTFLFPTSITLIRHAQTWSDEYYLGQWKTKRDLCWPCWLIVKMCEMMHKCVCSDKN